MSDYLTNFHAWLSSPYVPDFGKRFALSLTEQERAAAFADKPLVFGTAGIRGKVAPGSQNINKMTYRQMTLGYGKYLLSIHPDKQVTVLVAHDNRNRGVEFANTVADILTGLGIRVLLFPSNQPVSTPIAAFAIRALHADGGVIVTASHNPKEDNGFKIYDATGGQLLPEPAAQVAALMPTFLEVLNFKPTPNDALLGFVPDNIFAMYFAAAKQATIHTDPTLKKTFPVVFSGQHGTACDRLPEFLRTLGYTNIIRVVQQCVIDGNFPDTPSPNPENPAAWLLSYKYADHYGINVIIQVDPDADRFAIACKHNGQWRMLNGNETAIIHAWYVLRQKQFHKPPYIVASMVSTNLVDRIAAAYGAKVYRVGTGFKWHGAKINEIGDRKELVVAFEEAIGVLNAPIHRDKDGYQAAALTLEIYGWCLDRGIDLIDLLEEFIYPEFGRVRNETVAHIIPGSDWKQKAQAYMQKVQAYDQDTIAGFKIVKVQWNELGGCVDWILPDDCWIRFRTSGTEPKFKVYYNLYGKSAAELDATIATLNAAIATVVGLK